MTDILEEVTDDLDESPTGFETISPDEVRDLIANHLGDVTFRSAVLELMAKTIRIAHEISPSTWTTFIRKGKEISLNVGKMSVLLIKKDAVRLPLALDLLPIEVIERLKGHRTKLGMSFPQETWGEHEVQVFWVNADHLRDMQDDILAAYLPVVPLSVKLMPNAAAWANHIPAVIDAIESELDSKLPKPLILKKQLVWILQSNPKLFDLQKRLKTQADGSSGPWRIKRFMNQVNVGDTVIMWMSGPKAGIYALGKITQGPHKPDSDEMADLRVPADEPNIISYSIDTILPTPVLREELLRNSKLINDLSILKNAQGTIFPVSKPVLKILEGYVKEALDGTSDETVVPSLTDLSHLTNLDIPALTDLIDIIRDRKQIIFEGPPGSGKTHVARLVARYLTGNPLTGDAPNEQLELVQFHQSYGYEDFVQGIRPVTDGDGRLHYRVLPGVFTRFCLRARANPNQTFVFIIDEINRGNLSRIFGELLMLLEYRDERIRLPYAMADAADEDAYLTIPENLLVIGTMNSTDRSLAMIDYALRRRFLFYRMMPVTGGKASVLHGWLERNGHSAASQVAVHDRFVRLNETISAQLGPDYQIGHSYFMRDGIDRIDVMSRVWDRALGPLLHEYFHTRRDSETVIDGLRQIVLGAMSDPAPDVQQSAEEDIDDDVESLDLSPE